ncbi:hypothetical protein PIROE2DRAFT_59167 [Piromyces sp. E2]|nr:hypothetical protein PIROE2DRAFT_59167 [Piromyces sp. E2]|eukprot:OUM66821.1 hypothetical protein PIROE2DRAFT_59167 [Piromyces sp. E2]
MTGTEVTKEKKGHPKGLYLLFVTEMAERFSYYGMRGLFTLYLLSAFADKPTASQIYGSYTGLVYLTPLLGGFISDRFWGNRRSIIFGGILMAIGQFFMFGSACFVKQAIFEKGGVISKDVNNNLSYILMFVGLFFLIMGNGFFKPNISTMVGDLYEPNDKRKDVAFTIFYMGINVGAFFAPIVCAWVTGDEETKWMHPDEFKWGFFCAGVGMVFSCAVFIFLKNKLLVTPEGLAVGLPPAQSQLLKEKQEMSKMESGQDSQLLEKTEKEEKEEEANEETKIKVDSETKKEKTEKVKNSPLRLIGCIIVGVGLAVVFSLKNENFTDYISAIIYACCIALPLFIILDKNLNREERSRIGVIYIIAVFTIFFWSAYEQAGSSLTIIANEQVDRNVFGMEFKTPWFQSVNPLAIVILAPIVAYVWKILNKFNMEPSSPVKQAIGLLFLSLGYVEFAAATKGLQETDKISIYWLFLLYIIHTIGELCLSPIGISMVTKLAPPSSSSLLMGVWFMFVACSNVLAGNLSALLPERKGDVKNFIGFKITTISEFLSIFIVMAGVASIILFAFCPFLKRMMKGVN